MPPQVNNNNPVRNAAPVNPMPQPGGARPPARLADYALTIDDFRNFASGKINAGGAEPGQALDNRHRWQSLENPKPNLSEAAAIRLSFAFALEDAGVSGAKLDAALRRLGLNADFSFAGGNLSVQPLSREEVKAIIEQSLGKRKEPQAGAPRPDPFPGLGPLMPPENADEKGKAPELPPQAKPEPQGANVPANVPVAPAKVEAKAANGLPKIGSQAEFKAFIQSLRTDSAFGTVSEDAEEKDVNGDMKKTFTYTGLVFRLDDRGIDHPTMANGFTSKNDLALSKNKTEAMGLGTGFIDNEGKFVHGEYGITGESGVSTAKTIDGCIQYRHGKCSLYVIDTSKLPPGEKAWDMESTLYRNGYREKHGGIDETTGEVNVSSIPKSAIVGWVEIDDGAAFGDIKDNGKRLEHVQTHGRFVFNAEYKAVE
jgi:hypothetical protein